MPFHWYGSFPSCMCFLWGQTGSLCAKFTEQGEGRVPRIFDIDIDTVKKSCNDIQRNRRKDKQKHEWK